MRASRNHAGSPRPRIRWGDLADGAALVLGAWWIARLVGPTQAARLRTDECFHATMSQWLAAHHALPAVVPGLYSGFAYYYPPLYHVLGAVAVAAFGASAFQLVNVLEHVEDKAWLDAMAERRAAGSEP